MPVAILLGDQTLVAQVVHSTEALSLSAPVVNPHFALPFRFDGPRGVPVYEQDSLQEVTDCVEVILRYEKGSRPEKEDFGIDDQTFASPSVNPVLIQASLSEWEPRIDMEVGTPIINTVDELVHRVEVKQRA